MTLAEDARNMPSRVAGGTQRATEPPAYFQRGTGGLMFIPRRGVAGDFQGLLTTRAGLERFAAGSPLRLLSLLPDVHPEFGFALWNALRLACPPDGMKLVAVNPVVARENERIRKANDKRRTKRERQAAKKQTTDSQRTPEPSPGQTSKDLDAADEAANAALTHEEDEEEQDGEENEEGTALIEQFWADQPKELGGMYGCLVSLVLALFFTGLPIMECVPGPRGTGLRRVFPIDSLTVKMNREGDDGDIVLYQLQRYPRDIGKSGGYVLLPPERMLWRAIDAAPDDPYGRAPYAPAVAEVLRDLAIMQDLTDAIHYVAYPRPAFGFNFIEMEKVARETFNIEDPDEVNVWVMKQFKLLQEEFSKIKPGEAFFFDSNGQFRVVEGSAGFSALTGIMQFLRSRITQALKCLPTILGIMDGNTSTYSTTEYAIYTAGLETIRGLVAWMMAEAMTMHLRLLGKPLVCRPVYSPIRTVDALMDANTEAVKIMNEAKKVAFGWQSNDQAANAITGSNAVGVPNFIAGGANNANTSNNPAPISDLTKEDRNNSRSKAMAAEEAQQAKARAVWAKDGGSPEDFEAAWEEFSRIRASQRTVDSNTRS